MIKVLYHSIKNYYISKMFQIQELFMDLGECHTKMYEHNMKVD
jgi:hypothetical protein